MNKNKIKVILRLNQIEPGIKLNNQKSKRGCQPPKKRVEEKAHINKMLAHSPK